MSSTTEEKRKKLKSQNKLSWMSGLCIASILTHQPALTHLTKEVKMSLPIVDLPLAVLDHVLRPMLDYNGRMALNALLPPSERRGTPLVAEAVIKFGIRLATAPAGRDLRKVQYAGDINARAAALLKFFQRLPRSYILTEHNAGFRASCVNRLRAFADPTNPDFGTTARPLKRAIVAVAAARLAAIEQTCPFKTEVAAGTEELVFLEGAAPHHVVDNALHIATVAAALAAARRSPNRRRRCNSGSWYEDQEDRYWDSRGEEDWARYEAYEQAADEANEAELARRDW